jgi:hypothetical protein
MEETDMSPLAARLRLDLLELFVAEVSFPGVLETSSTPFAWWVGVSFCVAAASFR